MAYDASKDVEVIIKDIKKTESTLIRVKKVTNPNGEHLDIREMYTDKESGDIKFGKGIRFKMGLAPEIIEALQLALENKDEATDELPFNQ